MTAPKAVICAAEKTGVKDTKTLWVIDEHKHKDVTLSP
jgi:hypothetical protein